VTVIIVILLIKITAKCYIYFNLIWINNIRPFVFSDVAQGNFSEESVMPLEPPIQKNGSTMKDHQDPLRPELPSTTIMKYYIINNYKQLVNRR